MTHTYSLEVIAIDNHNQLISFDGGIYSSKEAARDAGLKSEYDLLSCPDVLHTLYNITETENSGIIPEFS